MGIRKFGSDEGILPGEPDDAQGVPDGMHREATSRWTPGDEQGLTEEQPTTPPNEG